MKKIKYMPLLMLMTIYSGQILCSAQNIKELVNTPTTPEASALINAIKYPMGYNIGKADITIPLHQITVGGLTIPITMSYNTKGLKKNEMNNRFGIGWTLSVEPVITNAVRGKLDVSFDAADPFQYKAYSDPYMQNLIRYDRDFLYTCHQRRGHPDMAPDDYFYKLPNNSGSFISRHTGGSNYVPSTVPYDPIKIETADYRSFTLTDDKGFVYTFPKENTERSPESPSIVWKATSIRSPYGHDAVTFTYNSDAIIDIIYSNNDMVIVEDIANNQDPRQSHNTNMESPSGYPRLVTGQMVNSLKFPHEGTPYEKINVRTDFSRKLIYKITYDEGTIEFVRKINTQELSSIIVKDNNNKLVKTITFNTTIIPAKNNLLKYAMLNSVVIKDAQNIVIDKYEFTYNGDPYCSNDTATNFWGYTHNRFAYLEIESTTVGAYINPYGVGDFGIYDFVSFGGGDKEKSPSKDGMLLSIKNMLGGVTAFEYENDKYIKIARPDNYDSPYHIVQPYSTSKRVIEAGGLRIKSITETDAVTNAKYRKTFKYGQNEDGNGIIRRQIYPENYMSVTLMKSYGLSDVRQRKFHSSLISSNTFGGIPVVYDRVSEYSQAFISGQWVDNGKTVYTYNYDGSQVEGCSAEYVGYEKNDVHLDHNDEWKWGQLTSKSIYGKNNKLLKKTEYQYTTLDQSSVGIQYTYQGFERDSEYGTWEEGQHISKSEFYGMQLIGCSILSGGVVKMTSEKTEDYDETNNNYIQLSKTMEYNNIFKYPSKSRIQDSFSDVTEEYKYVCDMPFAGLSNKWIVSPVMQKTVTYADGKSDKIINEYTMSNNNPVVGSIKASYDGGTAQTRLTVYNYDKYGNPIHVKQDNNTNVVFLWGYQGRYLIAEIKNATYAQVRSALGQNPENISELIIPSYANLDNLRNSSALSSAHITTYRYTPFRGISSITDPSGREMKYDYDGSGRLVKVTDPKNNVLEEYKYYIKNQ